VPILAALPADEEGQAAEPHRCCRPGVAPPRQAHPEGGFITALLTGLVCGVLVAVLFGFLSVSTPVTFECCSARPEAAPAPPQTIMLPTAAAAPAEVGAASSSEPVTAGDPPWTVEGGPRTSYLDAAEDALLKAKRKIGIYLRSLNSSLEWEPDTAYIQKRLVKEPWEQEKKSIEILGQPTSTYIVRMKVEISPRDRAELLKQAHDHLVQQRMFWLGKILAGVVVLLTAVAGYLRLDEWSKGYYTGWLRVATVSLLVGAGLGLLFLM
jgi:hypothetical protein